MAATLYKYKIEHRMHICLRVALTELSVALSFAQFAQEKF
jgi:hypothetical protein